MYQKRTAPNPIMHTTAEERRYTRDSCWKLNLSGTGYRIDLIISPFSHINPVFTTRAVLISSPVVRFCTTSVPENRKCFTYKII